MRRGYKVSTILGIIFLLLLGLLVVADRVIVNMAEKAIVKQVDTELAAEGITASSPPRVTIHGFPFLTQVLAGEYEKIDIGISSPKTSETQLKQINLTIRDLEADAMAAARGGEGVRARRVEGTAIVGWKEVAQMIKIPWFPQMDPSEISISANKNDILLSFPLASLGYQGSVTANGKMKIEKNAVMMRLTNIRVEAGVASPVIQRIVNQYGTEIVTTIPIPTLPYQPVLDRVLSDEDGLVIVATAVDVVLGK